MKNIRKLKKYGTAVAGTALLVGATLTGAAAQTGGSSGSSTTLGDFPQPFVDEDGNVQSSIVVGEDAATADVVGSIDIAGVIGQDAFMTESVDSGVSVDGKEYSTGLRNAVVSGSDLLDKSDYSKLLRKTVTDSNDENHFVVERAGLDTDNGGPVATEVNGSNVLTKVPAGAVDYEVSYTPGFSVDQEISLLGEEYMITALEQASTNEVKLGTEVSRDELALDETYTHGPYTVKVEDFNQEDNTVLVQVSKEGQQLKMEGLSTGESLTVESEALNVSADSIYFGSQDNYISLSSTYTDTVLTEGEELPQDSAYKVQSINLDTEGSTLQGLEITNKKFTSDNPEETDSENDVSHLSEGETFEGPSGYFQVNFEGLEDVATTGIEVKDGYEVTYTDSGGFEQTLNISNVVSAGGAIDVTTTNPWSSATDPVAFDDSGTSGTWESSSDLIVQDYHNGGTVSVNADTVVSSGDDGTVDMSDGSSATSNDFAETTYKAVDDGNNGFDAGTDDDIVTDDGGSGTFSAGPDTPLNKGDNTGIDSSNTDNYNQLSSITGSTYYVVSADSTFNAGEEVVMDSDNDGYYTGEQDTVVDGQTPSNSATLATSQDADWSLSTYDSSDGDSWDSGADLIAKDADGDGQVTATTDQVVDVDGTSTSTDYGTTSDMAQGDQITEYTAAKSSGVIYFVDDGDTNNAYDSDDDVYFSGSDGVDTADTLISEGSDAAVASYSDTANAHSFDSADNVYIQGDATYNDGDDVVVDSTDGGTYSKNTDTQVAGVTLSTAGDGTAYGTTGSFDSNWDFGSYDADDSDTGYDSGTDAIILDKGGEGTYSSGPDTMVNPGETDTATDGTSLVDLSTVTSPNNIRWVNVNSANGYDAGDEIFVDDDQDGVYTSTGDTVVNDEGTANRDAGDALVSVGSSARFYNADGSGSYTTGDEIYLDDDSDGVYTAQADNHLAGDALTDVGAGTSLTKTNPWSGASKAVFFYDTSSSSVWESGSDLIALDSNEDGNYQTDDTKLAGTEPSASSSTGLFEVGSDRTVYTDVSGHPVKVEWDQDDGEATVSYESFSGTVSSVGSETFETGYGFSLTLEYDDTDGDSTDEIDISGADKSLDTQYGKALKLNSQGSVEVDEGGDGFDVDDPEVAYTDNEVSQVSYNSEGTEATVGEEENAVSDYGTDVSVGDDNSPVTFNVPEEKREAVHTVGSQSSGEGGTVSSPAGWPGAGALDSEADTDQNLILVGGPAINDLTQDLAENNQTRSANEWQTGGHEGTSILQLTEGFDGEGGNKALVVAGHGAEDTRTASEFLANYGDHSDALEGESQVTISTETGNVVQ